ncbi:MAG: YfcE family phosphodiesterase [Desulfuromonadaceae bacterium]|nr:YfcE family phosphodiesterase [Desulfuromonadaceae bacterium]
MLKLGIISDTHWSTLPQANAGARKLLSGVFANVDAIVHAGDMVHPDLDMVFAPHDFYAVRGNMDPPSSSVPLKRILHFAGVNIGLIHGWGSGAAIESNSLSEFDSQDIDILVYGHSHCPTCRLEHGLLRFNPGSVTQRRRAAFRSVGLLNISACSEIQSQSHVCPFPPIVHQIEDSIVFISSAGKRVAAQIINIDAEPEIV